MIILAQMWLCLACITSAGLALWHWMGAWEDEWSRVSLQFVHILCVYCVNNVGLLKTKLFVWVSGNSGSIASVALKEKDRRGFQLRIGKGMQSSFIQSHRKETLKHLWVFRRTQPGTTGLGRVCHVWSQILSAAGVIGNDEWIKDHHRCVYVVLQFFTWSGIFKRTVLMD